MPMILPFSVICSTKDFVLGLIAIENIFARLVEQKIMALRHTKKKPAAC